ncbi:MAG TPA: iron ABC transporter permease [Bryobacteraceae bacterium]|jgi:iron complex transport system permease protein
MISSRRVRTGMFYSVMLPALLISAIAGIAIGTTPLAWQTIVKVCALKILPAAWPAALGFDMSHISAADQLVVWIVRIPRVLVAAAVGAGLGTAGAIMQGLFRNPLAEPGLMGIGPGAALGGVFAFVTGWSAQSVLPLPILAMTGALLALALVYIMSTRGGVTPMATLLLAGIATGAFVSALTTLVLTLNIANWQIAQEVLFWMMGGLVARTWTHFWICAPFVLAGLAASIVEARELDLLMQGEEAAASLGVNVESSKRTLIVTVAVLTGACVAVAGMIGFVGLVVPHAVRLVLGPSHRVVLPGSAVAGAVFLIVCDMIARTIDPPIEIGLGVITALCGGPFFLVLLLRHYREASR